MLLMYMRRLRYRCLWNRYYRNQANGRKFVQPVSTSGKSQDLLDQRFISNFVLDETKDCFQIGRTNVDNDLIVHGPMHFDRKTGMISSTVSRLGCRNSRRFINELNSLKPQCPVMMHTIRFMSLDAKDRATREFQNLSNISMVYTGTTSFTVPNSDFLDLDESCRTYVYPSCGHVHGYHKSLIGKTCPICRVTGAFVPVALEMDSCFYFKKPTHVFNPCGHIASQSLCEQFANIPMFTYDSQGKIIDQNAKCPFCCRDLGNNVDDNVDPFNRLILQTENGTNWDPDSDEMIPETFSLALNETDSSVVLNISNISLQGKENGESDDCVQLKFSLGKPSYFP